VHRISVSLFTVLLAGVLLTLLFNSCKKDEQSSLRNYLTGYGRWELASLQSTAVKRFNTPVTDTVVTTCGTDRLSFEFDDAGNAICQNFQCLKNNTTGKWTLNKDSAHQRKSTRYAFKSFNSEQIGAIY
jgi:hypothetical protein